MGDRVRVVLACNECGSRNYRTTKAVKPGTTTRLTLKKFCSACGAHTLHSETK